MPMKCSVLILAAMMEPLALYEHDPPPTPEILAPGVISTDESYEGVLVEVGRDIDSEPSGRSESLDAPGGDGIADENVHVQSGRQNRVTP